MPISPPKDEDVLVVIPSGGAAFDGERVLMDVKAQVGLSLYAKYWHGRVRCVYRTLEVAKMGYAEWHNLKELPFEVLSVPPNASTDTVAQRAVGAALVLASGDNHRDLGLLSALARSRVVFIVEYTLRTRLDILKLSAASGWQKVKSASWILLTEIARRRALARAAGLQANGTPAFNAYGRTNARPHLYFDTRLRFQDFIGQRGARAKAATLLSRRRLNLVYSGRLELMKGADYIVPIASELKQRGRTPFVLHIFGSGSLASSIAKDIVDHGLEEHVLLHGPVDFDDRLVPFLKSSADLFLCCHPQGDPSCTYLETLGCGVPIVGFQNEAFNGVLELGPCGEGVAVGNSNAMVLAVERLDADRARLAKLTMGAADVASTRLFESTFAARVDHLRKITFQTHQE